MWMKNSDEGIDEITSKAQYSHNPRPLKENGTGVELV